MIMNNLNTYIIEKLHLNKNINANNITDELLDIFKPKKYSDDIKYFIDKWVKENNIDDLLIYVEISDYRNISKKVNNKFEVKYFYSIDSEPTKFLRKIYEKVNSNWNFIGSTTGLGFKDNYFSYADEEFNNSRRIYIIGNPSKDENIK